MLTLRTNIQSRFLQCGDENAQSHGLNEQPFPELVSGTTRRKSTVTSTTQTFDGKVFWSWKSRELLHPEGRRAQRSEEQRAVLL